MTLEQLQEKLKFLYDDDVRKDISIYATTPTTGLRLFNIENQFLDELKVAFIEEIKAVGSESFNKHSSKTVPSKHHKHNLTVIFSVLEKQVDKNEADNVPKRFVKEGRMNVNHFRCTEIKR